MKCIFKTRLRTNIMSYIVIVSLHCIEKYKILKKTAIFSNFWLYEKCRNFETIATCHIIFLYVYKKIKKCFIHIFYSHFLKNRFLEIFLEMEIFFCEARKISDRNTIRSTKFI